MNQTSPKTASPPPLPSPNESGQPSPASIFPPKAFMIVVGLWTMFSHFLLPDRDQVFDLFQRHPTPETLAYVLAFIVGGHWAGDFLLIYCGIQLLRGRWRLFLVGVAFVGVNFLIYGIILANKPPYQFHF